MSGSGNEGGAGPLKNAVLIAGPTASGKSALALEAARRTGGVIVNADSMQVYSVLRLLTARPSDEDVAAAAHFLYGHVHPSVAYSAGAWIRAVAALVDSGAFNGRSAIFVGGTGLYFRALLGGLAEIPQIDAAVRHGWRHRLELEGPQRLHVLLQQQDPEMAARLSPADGPRIARALEVLESTGRSIRDWRSGDAATPLVEPSSAERIVLTPDRSWLEARIRARFEAMARYGALDEVKALLALDLAPTLPAMKAIGVKELRAVLAGQLSMDEAIKSAVIATRQYAKRQSTWFRNQMGPEWGRFADAQEASEALFGNQRKK